ncbi:MAG: outer membrane lipoprotein chaperone LolA [Gammaproteobacteria bacterium]|nr:outer membrane lipoprotein chaperone LolA [Gammaproteobacteria bacterium]
MLNRKSLAALALSLLMCSLANAQSADETLTALLLNITTMKANFVQTIKDKSARSLQHTQGHFALQRPGKFRWEVVKPTAQVIIANGSRLWIYDPDLEQVTIRNFSKTAGQTPAFLLSDKNLMLGKDFNVESVPAVSAVAGTQIFQLTPKDKDDSFEKIKLTFVGKQIRQMQLEDRLGHLTTIAFQNISMGMPLPDALFHFTPPPKVDVIDETKNQK